MGSPLVENNNKIHFFQVPLIEHAIKFEMFKFLESKYKIPKLCFLIDIDPIVDISD